jgi:alkanesulfonate monooxygenase SsuD/methylene tetrahydromethanopterin reductase-like flavin-dependent oxidoreductase (luciferase family)
MRYAIDVAPVGEYADPRVIAALAVAAERAGWDGISTWDVLGTSFGGAAADPFVALAAVAAATERLRLITSVIVLPRRRPHLVAQAAATLDVLSGGRLTLGIGAGGDGEDFTAFGESFEPAARLERLDRDAAAIDAWLRGSAEVAVGPRPVQEPRPPIWVGGSRPGARRRAATWDGWIAVATGDDFTTMRLSAGALGEMTRGIRVDRALAGRGDEPFDVALFAHSKPGDVAMAEAYAGAGVTWWLESLSPYRGTREELEARIEAGPPRV